MDTSLNLETKLQEVYDRVKSLEKRMTKQEEQSSVLNDLKTEVAILSNDIRSLLTSRKERLFAIFNTFLQIIEGVAVAWLLITLNIGG